MKTFLKLVLLSTLKKDFFIMSIPLPVELNFHEVEEVGKELDEIYEETIPSLGSQDEKYIKRLISIHRSMAFVSRLVIFAALAFLPNWWEHSLASWWSFYSIAGFGVLLLASAKIIENMEIWKYHTTFCMGNGTAIVAISIH